MERRRYNRYLGSFAGNDMTIHFSAEPVGETDIVYSFSVARERVAHVVLQDKDGRILLVEKPRVGHDKSTLFLPSVSLLNPNVYSEQDLVFAIKLHMAAQLYPEYEFLELRRVMPALSLLPGMFNRDVIIFRGRIKRKEGSFSPDSARFFSPDELRAMLKEGDIYDITTVAGITICMADL